jgi:acyl-coenzyme A synthetase/AMP-(fatty) acid ligase
MNEIEVVDGGDRPLPDSTVGRLRVRGAGLASPLPGQGMAAGFRDEWFYPGEIEWLGELGYLFLQGRAAEVILRGGAKIYPAEVQKALLEHRDILEAAVIGRLNADNEDDVVAFVASRRQPGVGALLAHCRTRLTAHKVPRQIHFLPELPKNTSGKVDKPTLARIRTDQLPQAEQS